MNSNEKGQQLRTFRYRTAQVADLQQQREELCALAGNPMRSTQLEAEIAKLDSVLLVARLALARIVSEMSPAEKVDAQRIHRAEDHPACQRSVSTAAEARNP